MIAKTLLARIINKPVLVETNRFLVKLAENREEVERAQRLRYEVFNLEQGRGLGTASEVGIDSDDFDEYFLHLLVVDKKSGRVIGTYRANLGFAANSEKSFYSSREYRIKGLERIADQCLELGRSCVDPEFRNGAVISLLWYAIAELLVRANLRYMVGCVSLEKNDPKIGWAVYQYLCQTSSLSEHLSATPRAGFELKRPPNREIETILASAFSLGKHIPSLFKGYLRLGALICGEPAMDKEFGTIDFFIVVDVSKIPERYTRHFKYVRS
jgi:putative hemolysin